MTRGELAVSYHPSGNNCAQCVLKSCAEYTGLDEITAEAVANGFGGGLRSGEICGAISGGVMAIGLAARKKGLTKINPIITEYVNEFREKYGHVRCVELKQEKIPCDGLIEFGADMAEKYINEKL
ncbi:MAG: C-GCAxxG-C-C family protein [Eubacteriales bacterium]|nr:C-GCAxxG-C-C family protein [Eubacteriales bacterium]